MKTPLYIVNTEGVTSRYGIGKYGKEFLAAWREAATFQEKWEITVINICNYQYDTYTEIMLEGIRHIYIPAPLHYDYTVPEHSVLLNKALVDILTPELQEVPEAVLNFMSPFFGELAGLLKACFPEITMILTYHAVFWGNYMYTDPEAFEQLHMQALKGLPRTAALPEAYERSFTTIREGFDAYIAVTEFGKRDLHYNFGIPEEMITVIYNGTAPVDVVEQTGTRAKYGFQETDILVLFSGRIEEAKGADVLIKAFLEAAAVNDKLHLVMAGGCSNFRDYLKLAAGNIGRIHFTGYLDNPVQLADMYTIADIGVVPSRFEQCSYTAIEMMWHGLPVIISDVPGLNELVADGRQGYAVTDDELHERILQLAGDEALRARLSRAARQRAAEQYTSGRMLQHTMQVIAAAAERKITQPVYTSS